MTDLVKFASAPGSRSRLLKAKAPAYQYKLCWVLKLVSISSHPSGDQSFQGYCNIKIRWWLHTRKVSSCIPTGANFALLSIIPDSVALMQADAGAQAVQIFDSWASNLAPQDYDIFAGPYINQIVDSVKQTHPDLPLILYISGSGGLLERMAKCNVEVISVDGSVDMKDAIRRIGPKFAVQVCAYRLGSMAFLFSTTVMRQTQSVMVCIAVATNQNLLHDDSSLFGRGCKNCLRKCSSCSCQQYFCCMFCLAHVQPNMSLMHVHTL